MKTNKLYPYPILYSEPKQGNYTKFKLELDLGINQETMDDLIKDNVLELPCVKVNCTESNIKKMLKNNKAKALLLVTSSGAAYRELFEVGLDPTKVNLGKQISGEVDFQVFLVINEDGAILESPNFDFPFSGRTFKLNQADIIGISDTHRIYLNWNWDEHKDGLFKFVKDSNMEDGIFKVRSANPYIEIIVSEKTYKQLFQFVKYNTLPSVIQSILIVPAVAQLISDTKKDLESGEVTFDLLMNRDHYSWFQNLIKGSTFSNFGEDDLARDAIEVAQKLLSAPLKNIFKELEGRE